MSRSQVSPPGGVSTLRTPEQGEVGTPRGQRGGGASVDHWSKWCNMLIQLVKETSFFTAGGLESKLESNSTMQEMKIAFGFGLTA